MQRLENGQRIKLDGVFFTEKEARISAGLVKGTMRGARGYLSIYSPDWNPDPDPDPERALRLEAMLCREILARRLGVYLPIPQEVA